MIGVIFSIFFMIGIFALIFQLSKNQIKKLDRYFAEFAELKGLEVIIDNKNWFKSYPCVQGQIKGRDFRLFMFTRGSGKHKKTFTAFELGCDNSRGSTLRLYQEGFFNRIGKKLGLKDIQLGDKFFDDKYIIQSNDPSYPTDLLNEDMKSQLTMVHSRLAGELKVEMNHIYYEEMILMDDDKTLAHFIDFVDLTRELAERVELC